MHHKTIIEISNDLRQKKYSALELTKYLLARIKKIDPQLNSFITITEEQALHDAKKADELLQAEKCTLLTGIPIAHKDLFCTKGVKTTCGSKMLANFVAPYDATVVDSLQNAGAVSLGKTNMDEFAMGSSSETSYFGAIRNPWHLELVPGGSSGGSAVAVAAGLVPATTGTDTGGSIRQPAALCGVTGLKPTYGRVSRYGMVAFASSLDQAGTIARTAEDLALLLNFMAGFDVKDSTSVERAVPDYSKALNNSLQGLRVGLPKEYFNENLAPEIQALIENAIKELKKLGVIFKDISLPHSTLAISAYYVIAPAECSSNLARFDGVRYGYRCRDPINIEDLFIRSRTEGFGDEVKRRILVGTYVLSAGYYDAYYIKAQKVRRLIKDDFVKVFTEVDAILGPTVPEPAFKIGTKSKDLIKMYLNDIYTVAVNLAGLPALSMPGGFVKGLPIGIQLIGNYFDEERILNIAHQYQTVTDWHKHYPDIC